MKTIFTGWYEKKMFADAEIAGETRAVEQLPGKVRTIAIVGISKRPTRDSCFVGSYLQKAGYTVVPVNPPAGEILGEICYPDLKSIPFDVDVVNVFRKPEQVRPVVDQALEIKAPYIWLQLGVGTHDKEATKVKNAGATLIQNRCIKADHQFLIRPKLNNKN